MGGSLMAAEAVLQAVLLQKKGKSRYFEVALSQAAAYLALPRGWGLTQAGAAVGGGHAGYRIYRCKDGRVAVAALEPHFARSLCAAAGIAYANILTMLSVPTQQAIASYMQTMTRQALETLAKENDIPLYTLGD
jgi:crotonobetainyl-CoA:carnitine CoA-transferase CaiB-like acyl-CoA transferase